jgi:hypothetical protein
MCEFYLTELLALYSLPSIGIHFHCKMMQNPFIFMYL